MSYEISCPSDGLDGDVIYVSTQIHWYIIVGTLALEVIFFEYHIYMYVLQRYLI